MNPTTPPAPAVLGERLYLVLPEEADLPIETAHLVSAPDEETARACYVAQVLAQQDYWLEYVYNGSPTAGFASHFYSQAGIPLLDEQGDWLCEPDEARATFEANVRRYFGTHDDWADLFIRCQTENRHIDWRATMDQWRFPPDMVGYMMAHLREAWCDLLALALDEIPLIGHS